MEHVISLLKRYRAIGATHFSGEVLYKKVKGEKFLYKLMSNYGNVEWVISDVKRSDVFPLDFSPLDGD